MGLGKLPTSAVHGMDGLMQSAYLPSVALRLWRMPRISRFVLALLMEASAVFDVSRASRRAQITWCATTVFGAMSFVSHVAVDTHQEPLPSLSETSRPVRGSSMESIANWPVKMGSTRFPPTECAANEVAFLWPTANRALVPCRW